MHGVTCSVPRTHNHEGNQHMRNVARERVRIKPTENEDVLADVFLHIHTIELSSSQAIQTELLAVLRPLCGYVDRKPMRDRLDPSVIWSHRLFVNQPSPAAIAILDRYMREAKHKVAVCRLHIALDFDPRPGVTREQVIELIETAFHLRYRRDTDEYYDYLGTQYSVQVNRRKTRPARQTAFYCDRVGYDGELDKIHYEIRLEKKRSVLSAGIEYPSDAFDTDPQQFVTKHVKIADHKPALKKIIDKAIKATKEAYANPHVDIERRVRSMFRRMGTDTLTGFKRLFPIRAERLKPMNVLNISNRLHWVNEECGELSPLSPAPGKQTRKRIKLNEDK